MNTGSANVLQSVTKVDIRSAIKAAYSDPQADALAWSLTAKACEHLATAPLEGRKTLGGSDCGGCVLEKWAGFQGLLAPFDLQTRLTRLDLGTLFGARMAGLLAAGLSVAQRRGIVATSLRIECEPEVTWDGFVGHPDAVLYDGSTALGVYELKTNYWPKGTEPEAPHLKMAFQCWQGALYALAVGAPTLSMVVCAPALTRSYEKGSKEPIEPIRLKQFDYPTEMFRVDVERERDRLQAALGADEPQCDAKEAWRAKNCRYAQCPSKC